jgi:predicted dehydrogenase
MAERGVRAARIAVVGAGTMGRWHAHAAAHTGAQVVAVVDVRPEAAVALAGKHDSASVFPGLDDALAALAVDVVHVCTPVGSHATLVETALASGRHALVEKPLAASLAETDTLLGAARDRGLALNPVHQLPFQSGFRRLLDRRTDLGDLVRVTYRTCSAGGDGRSAPERRELLLEILPHPVSLLYGLFRGALEGGELEVIRFTDDDLDLSGEFGDTLVDVSISLRGRPTRNEFEVVGTHASALADLFHGYALVQSGRVSRPAKVLRPFRLGGQLLGQAGANLAGRAARREPAYPGLRELVRRFHAAAVEGAAAPISEAETRAAAALVDRVRAERS